MAAALLTGSWAAHAGEPIGALVPEPPPEKGVVAEAATFISLST